MNDPRPNTPPGGLKAALGTTQSPSAEPVPLVHTLNAREGRASQPILDVDQVPHVRCRLLVASADREAVHNLQRRLGSALTVEHVEQIVALIEQAPMAQDERVALLLDCKKPTMHPASVAGLADELPYGWWVIAWGIDTLTWEELEPDREGPLHWVRCAPEADWNDVVGLSSTLLAAGC